MTDKEFKELPFDKPFSSGVAKDDPTGLNMTNSGNELRWIAKKGRINDWAIYCYWNQPEISDDYILKSGQKVYDLNNVKNVIDCDDEMLKRYRR